MMDRYRPISGIIKCERQLQSDQRLASNVDMLIETGVNTYRELTMVSTYVEISTPGLSSEYARIIFAI